MQSNRNFGLCAACVFLLLSAYATHQGAHIARIYAWLMAAAIVSCIAIATPNLLTPFNKTWMKVGDLMGKVVSPFVLGIIFFVLITPVAIISKLFGRDELHLKKANTKSYWINRLPPGPAGDSFKNQF